MILAFSFQQNLLSESDVHRAATIQSSILLWVLCQGMKTIKMLYAPPIRPSSEPLCSFNWVTSTTRCISQRCISQNGARPPK
ncbi:hypothetical protein VNO77_03678 [Canavalia gladiata]|uniref:Uncharacterized protein n=1 Tax=Canavalia gladiata TaxID=3824 RepID=A0AAN9RCG6_CANGL